MTSLSYAADLTKRLVQCPSVTPLEAGTLDLLQAELEALNFVCTRLPFGVGDEEIDNLFARYDGPISGPHIAFAGHVDVVPVGDETSWQHPPFDGAVQDGNLFGRGTVDMKGGIAAFVGAVKARLDVGKFPGSISLIITGDEEGDALNGTVKMVEWCREQGHIPDMIIVGEPTNPNYLGQTIKNGRRGSVTCWLKVIGTQGHVAYPHLANNPMPALVEMLAPVNSSELDGGTPYFDPSTAEITAISAAEGANNVIPHFAEARFNIRFNTEHSAASLEGWLREHFDRVATAKGVSYEARFHSNAAPFVTEPGPLTTLLVEAAETVTGHRPTLSTSGGTSDARFLCHLGPVAEFGLIGQTMHKIDEHVSLADIDQLTAIYLDVLNRLAEEAPNA